MADTVTELRELFSSASPGELEVDVLTELQSIMRLHNIPPQELFFKWEAYSMKLGDNDMKLNIDTARGLKQDVQDSLERENRSKAHHRIEKRAGATPRHVAAGDVFGMLDGLVPNTPRAGTDTSVAGSKRKTNAYHTPSISRIKQEPASSPPQLKTPYKPDDKEGLRFHDRANAGQVVEELNSHLPSSDPPIAPYPEPRIKLAATSDMKKLSYKPMAMKALEASEILDDRIDEFASLIQDYHKLEDSAFTSAAAKSTNDGIAVGRIACDTANGKLNAASLVLETSRRMGGGLRVPLSVSQIPSYQFFPGQIVALRGINVSGSEFAVSEILDLPPLPAAANAPTRIDEHLQRLRGGPETMDSDSPPAPLSILVGAGPYTSDENLDFEPLHAVCSQAADSYADVLLLCGPFLDTEHPLLATGDFDLPEEALAEPDTVNMKTVFKYLISPAFINLTKANPSITIILVPSVRDAISAHVSWPQEPFPRQELSLPKNVRVVGNPMSLSLNEIIVGVSSQDVLSELRREELVAGRSDDGGLLARLSRYLISQRHYFPLYPPTDRKSLPATGTVEGVPPGAMLDVAYLKLGDMLNVRPDLLILPSALPPFAKVVEGVLVVNPGYVSKRKAVGTYARLSVQPLTLTAEESQAPRVGHRLFERAKVEVVRV